MTPVHGSAEFSNCGKFRHQLDRWWGDGPRALVCMANPSDAGAERNDPTIHALIRLLRPRCDGFAVVNWEPYIATSPADLYRWRNAVDADVHRQVKEANLARIERLAEDAELRIVAWGNLVPQVPQTTRIVRAMSVQYRRTLFAFGRTNNGSPKHPMARGKHRIRDGTDLIEWHRPFPASHDLEAAA